MSKPSCCPECGTTGVSKTGDVTEIYDRPHHHVERTVWACCNPECGLEWAMYNGETIVIQRIPWAGEEAGQ